MLENNPHFSFGFGCSLGRVYYQDKEFVCITMDRASYIPFATTCLQNMVKYLLNLFERANGDIDWTFNHPSNFPKRKKNKINQLLKETDCDKNILTRWLLLLII